MSSRQTRRSARKASQFIEKVVAEGEVGEQREDDRETYLPEEEQGGQGLEGEEAVYKVVPVRRVVERFGEPVEEAKVPEMAATFDCPQCNIKFREFNLLKLHNKLVHKIMETPMPDGGGEASQAKRMRPNDASPGSSRVSSPGPQPVPTISNECTKCSIKFRSYELLKVHNKLVHQIIMPDDPPTNGSISPAGLPSQQIKQEKPNAAATLANAKIDESGQLRFDDDDTGEVDAPLNDDSMPPTPPRVENQPQPVHVAAPPIQQPVIAQHSQPAPRGTQPASFECKLCNINFRSHALIKMHNKLVHKITTDDVPSTSSAQSSQASHSPRYAAAPSPPTQRQPIVASRASPTPIMNGHHSARRTTSTTAGSSDAYDVTKTLERAASAVNQKCLSLGRENESLTRENDRLRSELRIKDQHIKSLQSNTPGGGDTAALTAKIEEQARQIQLLEAKNQNIKKALKMMDL